MMHYPRISLYALMLAAGGLPLYIHLPRFASVNLGIGLASVGAVLMAIRVIDLVQDPVIGWMIDRWPRQQRLLAALAAGGLAIGFPLLFSLSTGPSILTQLIAVLVLLFSGYSLGMILLYGRSATLAMTPTDTDLMRVATYREAGLLAGVVIAAIAPSVLAALGFAGQGYPAFGLFLGGLSILCALLAAPIWRKSPQATTGISFAQLRQSGALRLLGIAVINALPVAITSTLFLFFVQDRLMLSEAAAGPLLVLFFACAGLSVPIWSRLSHSVGARNTLMIGMGLSIVAFTGAALLSPGNVTGFALICAGSGAALGADMLLLPAMFSIALTRAGIAPSTAFGIWSLAGKLSLALAAFTVLPLLELNGFQAGSPNDARALQALTLSYAVLPCLLKLCALGMVLALRTRD